MLIYTMNSRFDGYSQCTVSYAPFYVCNERSAMTSIKYFKIKYVWEAHILESDFYLILFFSSRSWEEEKPCGKRTNWITKKVLMPMVGHCVLCLLQQLTVLKWFLLPSLTLIIRLYMDIFIHCNVIWGKAVELKELTIILPASWSLCI